MELLAMLELVALQFLTMENLCAKVSKNLELYEVKVLNQIIMISKHTKITGFQVVTKTGVMLYTQILLKLTKM